MPMHDDLRNPGALAGRLERAAVHAIASGAIAVLAVIGHRQAAHTALRIDHAQACLVDRSGLCRQQRGAACIVAAQQRVERERLANLLLTRAQVRSKLRARIAFHQHVAALRHRRGRLQRQRPCAVARRLHGVAHAAGAVLGGAQQRALRVQRCRHRRGACAGKLRRSHCCIPGLIAGQHHEAQVPVFHRQAALPARGLTGRCQFHRQQRTLGQNRRLGRIWRTHLRELLRWASQLLGLQLGCRKRCREQ